MSPLPRIHTSNSTFAMREKPASTSSAAGPADDVFAEVMRAVFHPAQHRTHRLPTATKEDSATTQETDVSPARNSMAEVPQSDGNVATAPTTADKNSETNNEVAVSQGKQNPAENASCQIVACAQPVQGTEIADQKKSPNSARRSADSDTPAVKLPPAASQKTRTDGGPSSNGTSGVPLPAPTANGGAASIPDNIYGSISNTTAGESIGLHGSGKNGLSNRVLNSSSQPQSSFLVNTGSSDVADPTSSPQPSASFGWELYTKAGNGDSRNLKNSVLPPEKDEKQPDIARGESSVHTINGALASGNRDQAANSATDAFSSASTAEDAGNVSNNSPKNSAGGTANFAASPVSSNPTDPSNGNASSTDYRPGTQNNNGISATTPYAKPQNQSSETTPPNTITGQNIAGVHIPTTNSRSEMPHADIGIAGVTHGEPGVAATSNTANVFGNQSLTHGVSSVSAHGTMPDTFMTMDSGAAAEHGVLLHATPHQIAVGVTDPALGWVEVRAERVDGQIAAALTAHSTASHSALTSIMPSMTTYLQKHHPGVQHVHVETGFAGNQSGAGSQGQSPSQGNAHSEQGNLGRDIASGRNVATSTEQPSSISSVRSTRTGHQVSIRA